MACSLYIFYATKQTQQQKPGSDTAVTTLVYIEFIVGVFCSTRGCWMDGSDLRISLEAGMSLSGFTEMPCAVCAPKLKFKHAWLRTFDYITLNVGKS